MRSTKILTDLTHLYRSPISSLRLILSLQFVLFLSSNLSSPLSLSSRFCRRRIKEKETICNISCTLSHIFNVRLNLLDLRFFTPSIHLLTDTPSAFSLQVNLVLSCTTDPLSGSCVSSHQRERKREGESQESKKKKVKGVGVLNSGRGLKRRQS
jgi:hypothetical protein